MEHCCERGKQSGISFTEKPVRVCRRHYTPDQAALVEDLEARGARIGMQHDDDRGVMSWPASAHFYVPSRIALLEWAESHGLKRASTYPKLHCVCWPTSKRLTRCECGHNGTQFYLSDSTWDHMSMWTTRNGSRAVVVFQPYQVTPKGQAVLDEWHARDDVHVEVREDSWYGHGTKFVGIWNAEFAPAAVAG
ncbi:hypothetical protein [Glycomyces sp. YM15]|uniref:hypothetical protein n=1 Tax=Glycomyces sp. YM15 TaxID=2800446 RepID=UPI0019649953|nr:hypothetical protein [Glycomyces sp. YM15]